MRRFLSKLYFALSPNAQYFVFVHGWKIAFAALILSVGGLYVLRANPDPYVVESYQFAQVDGVSDISDPDMGFRWVFTIDVPGFGKTVVFTQSIGLATQVVTEACVALRRHESGEVSFKLANRDYCADNPQ